MSPNTALRQLALSYSEKQIPRKQYVSIRTQLLNKLERTGTLTNQDLDNFTKIESVNISNTANPKYALSEIIMIVLGLSAAAVLAYVLYS